MSPSPIHSDADSDSDAAPEQLTLSSTKKASRTRAGAVRAFEAAQNAKRKQENRARDEALKEAAGERKSKKWRVGRGEEMEERMERAMRDAAAEESGEGEDEEEMAEDDDAPPPAKSKSESKPKHLPDHLFSALQSTPSLAPDDSTPTQPPKKQKRKKAKAKALIVGSRTVRTIPETHGDTASLTLPPARIGKFLKRRLQLKQSGGKEKGSGWERRAANVGVMRARSGPAMRFVRNGNGDT